MSLAPGTRVGPYEIVGALGAGGMGEVYRARDARLDRDVAIKILPELFAQDPERLTRFEREAKALAALNHPNIAAIYGIEVPEKTSGVFSASAGSEKTPDVFSDGRALVMELVEGEDLSAIIARGALPLAEALPLARQIADALEAAHEQGIVHRDLKPANIKVRADGTVKVLDFGLARTLDSGPGTQDQSNSPTLTARATQMGMIIGTAAYMAPEQAKGKAVDRRADIWAFGVVLYEMLTGRRAFEGEDVSTTLAAVLMKDPEWAPLPKDTPPSLRRLITRCLLKDPKARLRDIGEARVALDDAQRELTAGPSASMSPTVSAVSAPLWHRALPWTLVAGLLVGLIWTWASSSGNAATPPAITRLQVSLPPGVEHYTAAGAAIALSPDGSTLAFVGVAAGVRQVYLRRLDQFQAAPLKGSEGAVSCAFSPDGRELLVGGSDRSLRRVRLADGLVEPVAPVTSDFLGAWLDDGHIVYTNDGHLWMAAETPGSPPQQLTGIDTGSTGQEGNPVRIPGADALLFVSTQDDALISSRIEALTLDTKARTIVAERASSPILTNTGHLLFVRENALLAVRFDPKTLKTVGDASTVLNDVSIVRNLTVSAIMAVSDSGTLAYASGTTAEGELVSVSRKGEERTLLHTQRPALNPRLSPDGRRLVFEELGGGLWVQDLDRATLAPLTDRATSASFPIFSRDGREVVFRTPNGMFRQPLDGNAKPEHIAGTAASEFPTGFTLDGKELIYTKLTATTSGDVYTIPLEGGKPRALLSTGAYEGGAQLSPDGRWMAYVSNELGNSEIFLQPYPALNQRIQVSSGGGIHPVWNPKGGEILYRSGDRIMSVRVTASPSGPVLTAPAAVISGRYAFGGGLTIPNFSVSSDGAHFILVKEQSGASLNVVLNWFEELKKVR